ncbi:hypothetical protein CL176_05780 [Suicoccus acidiformans]|uniref:Uncharacterized protein n=1 Tax=Suicoccus acidiformans TaxID=2036206 RepID=A0A347WKD4_9LACT|nr:hypothetical protein [Suicoccus acidiformans]AXY25541.1 hypothetical protein CL176_05780 [Suicoccus acidiformans]
MTQVKDYIELSQALESGQKDIEIINSIGAPNGIKLNKGQSLKGKDSNILLSFINGDGIELTGDNDVANLSIQTAPAQRAIYVDSMEEDLGTVTLNNLTVTGMVQILTRGNNKRLNLEVDELDIISADARNYPERPMKYGVNVYQGAFTVYNFNPVDGSLINFKGKGIRIGRKNAPVLGSGLFVSGFNEESGPVEVEYLETEDIYVNGMIPKGQPNLITGAIFIVYGARAKKIVSHGVVETYGNNDMVLDVWGHVDDWLVENTVTSYGPSGIGFVNFGTVDKFRANKQIATYGQGARGFNQYDGTIGEAYFESIKTVGDGSIGMQFSKPVGQITVGDVSTTGSTGQTLVQGEIVELAADGISVLEGGEIDHLEILRDITTEGEGVSSYHVNGGKVKELKVGNEIIAQGGNSTEVTIENGGESDLESIQAYIG